MRTEFLWLCQHIRDCCCRIQLGHALISCLKEARQHGLCFAPWIPEGCILYIFRKTVKWPHCCYSHPSLGLPGANNDSWTKCMQPHIHKLSAFVCNSGRSRQVCTPVKRSALSRYTLVVGYMYFKCSSCKFDIPNIVMMNVVISEAFLLLSSGKLT